MLIPIRVQLASGAELEGTQSESTQVHQLSYQSTCEYSNVSKKRYIQDYQSIETLGHIVGLPSTKLVVQTSACAIFDKSLDLATDETTEANGSIYSIVADFANIPVNKTL